MTKRQRSLLKIVWAEWDTTTSRIAQVAGYSNADTCREALMQLMSQGYIKGEKNGSGKWRYTVTGAGFTELHSDRLD